MNEFETVIILSKYARIHKLAATVWTNDIVVIKSLIRLGATVISENNYELPLEKFIILPKQRAKTDKPKLVYPEIVILPNDNLDKETAINYTQDERKKRILHITTEDDFFIKRCTTANLSYGNGTFLSNNDFRAFSKKTKLTTEERLLRTNRMLEARHKTK